MNKRKKYIVVLHCKKYELDIQFPLSRVGEDLVFDPVRRGDGGSYLCLARNEVGASDEISISFDVLYQPENIRTVPTRFVELEVRRQREK